MLVERACSSSPVLLRPSSLIRLTAVVFVSCTLWFVWRLAGASPAPPAAPALDPAACDRPVLAAAAAPGAVNIVDVAAAAATPDLVAQLVRISDDERVTAVDDRPVASSLEAGALLAERVDRAARGARVRLADAAAAPGSGGEYLDVSVEGSAGSRRVIVLFH